MKFLNYIQESFQRVLAVDTEFRLDSTKTIPEKVICFVYTDVFTGEVFRYWEHNKTMSERHFDYEDVLLISFNATAEVGCYLKQLHGRPKNIFDCYVENARLYKPMRSGKGALSLLSTADYYKIEDKITEIEKQENLDLILRRNKYKLLPFEYNLEEQKQILDYCQSDTEVLRQIFIKQVIDIEDKLKLKTDEDFEAELWRILNRGYAVGCVARVEQNGIPVDTRLISYFNNNWNNVKHKLIENINKDIKVFTEDHKFNFQKFNELVIRNGLSHKWPRMKTGNFTTNSKVLKQNLHIPDIKKLNEIRTLQNMTKLSSYEPGKDGRVRTSLFMFGTVTGRTSPSTSKYPFNASKWARNFIKPTIGNNLVYIDYKSQEPAIMGYLSGDQNKINAYQSGDVYIYTAKLFNYVPEFATDETHPKERNIFKVLDLANNFGQGPMAVADQLKISVARAKTLQMKYRETFKTYFRWLEGYIEAGLRNGYLSTRFGWQRWIKDLFKIGPNGKAGDIRRSLMNWPIQAHGAEVLRKALIDLTDEHFEVCALVHDAILLQIPIPEFHERLEQAKRIMVNASIQVVGGPIQVEHETITGNYVQSKKDQKLLDEIMTEINSYTRSRNNLHPFQEHRPI